MMAPQLIMPYVSHIYTRGECRNTQRALPSPCLATGLMFILLFDVEQYSLAACIFLGYKGGSLYLLLCVFSLVTREGSLFLLLCEVSEWTLLERGLCNRICGSAVQSSPSHCWVVGSEATDSTVMLVLAYPASTSKHGMRHLADILKCGPRLCL